MKEKHAFLLKKCVNIVTAVLTVALGLCLIAACLGIYDGGAGEFSRAAVSKAFSKIAFAVYTWLAFVVFGAVLHFVYPTAEKRAAGKKCGMNKSKESTKILFYVRLIVIAAAAFLVVAGVCTGGMSDVLAKAINICTECVGLG